MKTKLNQFLLILFCSASFIAFSQTVEKLKFKKDPSLIYFFQKGKKSDTLLAKAENLFYLLVPDSLKKSLSIAVENGQLLKTANDSLFRFNYLPGFKYESFYQKVETEADKKTARYKYEFKTAVDGISIVPEGKTTISLINTKTGGLILENVFIYRE